MKKTLTVSRLMSRGDTMTFCGIEWTCTKLPEWTEGLTSQEIKDIGLSLSVTIEVHLMDKRFNK